MNESQAHDLSIHQRERGLRTKETLSLPSSLARELDVPNAGVSPGEGCPADSEAHISPLAEGCIIARQRFLLSLVSPFMIIQKEREKNNLCLSHRSTH